MKTTGYSDAPLEKKLGIAENFKIRLINIPDNYFQLFSDLPANVQIVVDSSTKKNFIHYFTLDSKKLDKLLPVLKSELESNGMIWISWPKVSSEIPSDLSEELVRNYALHHGLVDIKVCTVDEDWSGLKLVMQETLAS